VSLLIFGFPAAAAAAAAALVGHQSVQFLLRKALLQSSGARALKYLNVLAYNLLFCMHALVIECTF